MENNFYVYLHMRPDGIPFYVGKGYGNRSSLLLYRNPFHKNVVLKYGTNNLKVSKLYCDSEEQAFELEIELIALLRSMNIELTNMTNGGEGVIGYRHDPEDIKRRSNLIKGRPVGQGRPGPLGYKHTPEALAKIAEASRICRLTEEGRLRIIAANKGKRPTDESKEKNRQAHLGAKQSEETVFKRAEKNRGKIRSPETKALMAQKAKEREEKKRLERALGIAPLHPNKGRKFDEEHRRKVSERAKACQEKKRLNRELKKQLEGATNGIT